MPTRHWRDSSPRVDIRPKGNLGRALAVGLALAVAVYVIAALAFWIWLS